MLEILLLGALKVNRVNMFTAFITGLFLGFSLIIAIGAQNALVLRQGILRKHIFYVALFCSISDSLLITLGVTGISYFINEFIYEYSKFIYGFSAIWLFLYGFMRLMSAFKANTTFTPKHFENTSLLETISIVAVFTFANPHVYLDTVILIGSISQRFIESDRIYFTIGACSASFVWFFCLAYGARLLTPIMQKPFHWRNLDFLIAIIMFIIAFNLANHGDWF